MGFDYNEYQRQFPYKEMRGLLFRDPIPRIRCADGFSMSVQCSAGAYCSPRVHNASHYYRVEVGYPSERVEALMEYAEDSEFPTQTVYGYVPVEIVERIVAEHGGPVPTTERGA